jgi:hypothetical protein
MPNEFKIKNGFFSEGSSNVTGSLNVSAGITGSLQGTASFAISASFAQTASFALNAFPYTGSALISGSLEITGSFSVNNGTNIKLDTTTNEITDDSNSISIDWGNRELLDVSGSINLDWSGENTVTIQKRLHAGVVPLTNASYDLGDGVSSVISNTSFDSSLKASGTILSNQIAGGTITKGMLLFLPSDEKWKPANATNDTTSTQLLGYALNDAILDGDIDVLIEGVITLNAFHRQLGSATPGVALYIRAENGSVDQNAPATVGNVVRLIGHNITGGASPVNYVVIRFKPDNTWIEL